MTFFIHRPKGQKGETMIDQIVSSIESLARRSLLLDRRATLKQQIREMNRCGSCGRWMHYPDCPREKPTMTGYNRGPSMNGSPCELFVMTRSSHELVAEWSDEIQRIEDELGIAAK